MYEFIVLGIIPGTQIEISFQMWQAAITVLLMMLAIRNVKVARHYRTV